MKTIRKLLGQITPCLHHSSLTKLEKKTTLEPLSPSSMVPWAFLTASSSFRQPGHAASYATHIHSCFSVWCQGYAWHRGHHPPSLLSQEQSVTPKGTHTPQCPSFPEPFPLPQPFYLEDLKGPTWPWSFHPVLSQLPLWQQLNASHLAYKLLSLSGPNHQFSSWRLNHLVDPSKYLCFCFATFVLLASIENFQYQFFPNKDF